MEAFLQKSGASLFDVTEGDIAEYFCQLVSSSPHPKLVLNTTAAAITWFCEAAGIENIISQDLSKLIVSLVKSSTLQPMLKSKVMPLKRFTQLFLSWPGNYLLTIEKLRLKSIIPLAIAAMLRPLDAAPLARVFDEDLQKFKPLVLSAKNLIFHGNGALTVIFHGIKNDYSHDGFEVNIPPSSQPRVDPVRALQCYINRTKYFREGDCPLFLTLKQPFHGISAKSVARILDQAIELVGLKSEGYTAKHFRPSAATKAIQQGVDPDTVMRTGHWKSRATFENHYVHAFPVLSFTDQLLDILSCTEKDTSTSAVRRTVLQQL